jgi:hypothetical protein
MEVTKMDKCISLDGAIIFLSRRKCGNDEYDIAVQDCIDTLRKLPVREMRPVVRARLEYRNTKNGDGLFCTNCGERWEANKLGKYCYNCGADMSEYIAERQRRYEGG